MTKRRRVRPVSRLGLEALNQHRLLAYRAQLLSLEDSFVLSDMSEGEVNNLDSGYIYFKESAEWIELYAAVVELLGSRGHIDR